MADMTASVEVLIERPAEEVFKWVSEPANRFQWWSGVKSSDWIRKQESGSVRPEDRWEDLYEYGGKENLILMEVDTCDLREMVFEFHTVEGKYPIRCRYSCYPSDDHTLFRMTRTAIADSAFTSFMFKVTGFMSKPMMRKQCRREAEKLKVILEAMN